MLNPTLGRNLGRWAHVYFTSPPEKREQAVLQLLRELEAESGTGIVEGPSGGTPNHIVTEAPMIPETMMCAECGHQNAKLQRFCGMCGSSLTSDDPSPPLIRNFEDPPLRRINPSPVEPEAPLRREPAFPTLSLFAQVDEEATSSRDRSSDIEWLRDRRLSDDGSSPVFKYVLVAMAILLAAAVYYNRSWILGGHGLGQQGISGVWTGSGSPPVPSRPESTPSTSAPAVNERSTETDSAPKSTATAEPARQPEPSAAKPAPRDVIPPAQQAAESPAVANAGLKTAEASATSDPQEQAGVMSGAAELATAEEYLTGKRGPRNSAEAAKFLWKAVSKENTTAILLLSDLYVSGDGVPKSCDQARLLLYAAARKNVPEAGQKLRNLQAGCP